MLKVRETFETIEGFGCRYRKTTRIYLLFGIIPVYVTRVTTRR